jgi:hypothetical protein
MAQDRDQLMALVNAVVNLGSSGMAAQLGASRVVLSSIELHELVKS